MKFKFMCFIIGFCLLSCNGSDKTSFDVKDDYDKICIEGHVYYKRSMPYQGYLSIKLDDNGKPVKCNNR
jgi:hypothetical protein